MCGGGARDQCEGGGGSLGTGSLSGRGGVCLEPRRCSLVVFLVPPPNTGMV